MNGFHVVIEKNERDEFSLKVFGLYGKARVRGISPILTVEGCIPDEDTTLVQVWDQDDQVVYEDKRTRAAEETD